MSYLTPKKLNQSGFDHVFGAVLCFVAAGLVGTFMLVVSHAYTVHWKGLLEESSGSSGFCLTTNGSANGSSVALDPCNSTGSNTQSWSLNYTGHATVLGTANVQEFTLQSSSGTTECLNDPYGSKTNGVALQVYSCHSNDPNNLWVWGGSITGKNLAYHQLINVATATSNAPLCIDDAYGSHAAANKVQLWACKTSGQANQSWYEAKAGSSTSGGGSTGSIGGGSSMVVGVNMNGMTSNTASDMAGAVKYVRADLKSFGVNATTFTGAGLKVDDLLQGPYNTSGIAALGSATTWANNALGWYKADGCTPTLCPMVEVLNEPGGHWFWGNNAMTESNAAAYDNILIATDNAFKAAYGSSTPLVLASYDGGMSDGSGGWGQYMWQANKNIGNYINGITVHPYNTQSTGLGSQSNVTGSYAQAKSLAGRSIPMYITEVGWQTATASADDGDPPQSGTALLTPAQQCSNVYNYVTWARGLGYVNAVMFFDYRDDNASLGDGTYGMEYGDGSHKPAYNALQAATAGRSNPC